MQGTSMTCDGCGQRIEDMANPTMAYIVVGIPPLHPVANGDSKVPLQQFEMPQEMRDLFDNGSYNQPARVELCARCFGIIFRSKQVAAEQDKNSVSLKAGAALKDLNRPMKAMPGRIPLPAILHALKEPELRAKFDLLRPQQLTADQLPKDTKPTTKRRAKKAVESAPFAPPE